jgi:hypothetical protein
VTRRTDEEIERRFAEVRLNDAAGAPAFRDTLGRRGEIKRSRPRASTWLVAIALLALVSFGAFRFWTGRGEMPQDITQWRASSDVLLAMGGSPLNRPMPPLGTSVLDSVLRWNPDMRISR